MKKADLVKAILGTAALILTAVFLIFSEKASSSALKGIELCQSTLIPTLFPIMCLNSILIGSGMAIKVSSLICRPISKLFGIKSEQALPLFISALSSPPAGAAALIKMSDEREQKHLSIPLLLSTSMSIGFTVGFLGRLLNNKKRGLAIFLLQLISLMLSALLLKDEGAISRTSPHGTAETKSVGKIVSDAIAEGTNAIISVCGSVIFFSAITGIILSLPIPIYLKAILSSFFEITGGASFIASSLPPDRAFVYLSAAVGWTGLSMHCQVLAQKGGIPFGKYLLGKVLSTFFCALIAFLLIIARII